jgi:hypothetical protein
VQFRVYCAVIAVFSLTPLALRAQESQLAPLPRFRANPEANSLATPVPQVDPADSAKGKAIPQQTDPLPQEAQEIRSGTLTDDRTSICRCYFDLRESSTT